MFTLNPGHNFVSADCNKEKACIMNHLSGSVPLSRERLQQHKRKTSVRKGRHVRWASVAALEFFFLQRSHDKEDHYAGTKERATCSSVFKQRQDAPETFQRG